MVFLGAEATWPRAVFSTVTVDGPNSIVSSMDSAKQKKLYHRLSLPQRTYEYLY
jgi:hypothetical protein